MMLKWRQELHINSRRDWWLPHTEEDLGWLSKLNVLLGENKRSLFNSVMIEVKGSTSSFYCSPRPTLSLTSTLPSHFLLSISHFLLFLLLEFTSNKPLSPQYINLAWLFGFLPPSWPALVANQTEGWREGREKVPWSCFCVYTYRP